MKTKTRIKSIYEVLFEIQQELVAPKTFYNPNGEYNYRSAEGILLAVKPLLAKHKAVITLGDSLEEKCGHVYIKATATLHWKSETVSESAYACEATIPRAGMDAAQSTGASSSYARKYALCGLLAIDSNKKLDPDYSNKHGTDHRLDEAGARKIKACTTLPELTEVCTNLIEKNGVEKKGVTAVYEQRVRELTDNALASIRVVSNKK